MIKKYNWEKIKQQYIHNKFASLKQFAKDINVPYGRLCAHCGKWTAERKAYQAKLDAKTTEKTIENLSEKIAKANAKHLQYGYALQKWAIDGLFEKDNQGNIIGYRIDPQSAYEAIEAIKQGVKIERDVLGLNNKEVTININDVKSVLLLFVDKTAQIINDEVGDKNARDRISRRLVAVCSEAIASQTAGR